jgi:hypothetical protein
MPVIVTAAAEGVTRFAPETGVNPRLELGQGPTAEAGAL